MHIVHAAHGATYGRFTLEHAAAIIRLVGGQKVCWIDWFQVFSFPTSRAHFGSRIQPFQLGALINELCQNIGLQLYTVCRPYIEALMKGMPKEIKNPGFMYGTDGALALLVRTFGWMEDTVVSISWHIMTLQTHTVCSAHTHTGIFSFYLALLRPLLQYSDLNTEVNQVFRIIGNTLVLVQMMEHALDLQDIQVGGEG